jgi:hypothetical protein
MTRQVALGLQAWAKTVEYIKSSAADYCATPGWPATADGGSPLQITSIRRP